MHALIIAPNEVCYNPRLLKAADVLIEHGCDVVVHDTILGVAPPELYAAVVGRRAWTVLSNDVSGRTPRSRARWVLNALAWKSARAAYLATRSRAAFPFFLSKGLCARGGHSRGMALDLILVNVVDNLPRAAALKRRNPGAVLVYDSQEYFRGQFSRAAGADREWVERAERWCLPEVDILCATTQVMLDRIRRDHGYPGPAFRVRNVPYHVGAADHVRNDAKRELDVVWHGHTIHDRNNRGVHLLLEAVALSQAPVRVHLQGRISESERGKVTARAAALGLGGSIAIHPPADPDFIVESLRPYDIGVCAEIPDDENQLLTASNKLFDYFAAGLAVTAPDVPGIAETVAGDRLGELYPAGDVQALAEKIRLFARDANHRQSCAARGLAAARSRLNWKAEYQPVWDAIASLGADTRRASHLVDPAAAVAS